jgi:putative transcriptional regulator
LEHEIKQNTWLTCPASAQLLFQMPYEQRWKGSAQTLGIDLNLLGLVAGHG